LYKKTQDAAVDWWAVGCTLFFCITGGKYLFKYKGRDQIKHTSDKLLEIQNGKNVALNKMEPRCKCII